jgi:hypothetical protein
VVVSRNLGRVLVAALVVLIVAAGCAQPESSARVGAAVDEPAGPPVALVPSPEWLGIGRLAMASEGPIEVPHGGTVVLERAGDDLAERQVVFVTVVDEPVPAEEEGQHLGEPVVAGPLSGYAGVDEYSGHRWLTVGSGSRHLNAWAGPGTAHDDLVALAARLDIDRQVTDQKLGAGWRVVTTAHDALDGGWIREYSTHSVERRADLYVAIRTGVDDHALDLLGSATISTPTRVRGRNGLLTQLDGRPDEVTLTWLEVPGTIIQMRYASTSETMLADALRTADALTRVDLEGWDRFATLARVRTEPPEPSADESEPPVVVFRGQLWDGRGYVIEERDGATLCITVDGLLALTRCDTDQRLWRDRAGAAMPRLLDPGDLSGARSPVVMYGYLPVATLEGTFGEVQAATGPGLGVGRAVSVEVVDSRGIDLGRGTLAGDVWVHHVPDVDRGLVVTYRFLDGSELVVAPGSAGAAGDAR